ncbi:MAG: hypothetical protein HWD60_04010 [Defluviicoccus sp.]|nr:MAG: hypothetical protein HWD60_04010 [Defluviicoccus sp.]
MAPSSWITPRGASVAVVDTVVVDGVDHLVDGAKVSIPQAAKAAITAPAVQ